MSEYDSLKVISQPPYYRWTGLPDIFSCASPFLIFVFHFWLVEKRRVSSSTPGFCCFAGYPMYRFFSSKRNEYFIPTLTIRNQQGLPSSCVLLFIHATPCGRRQSLRNLAKKDDSLMLASVTLTT